MKFVSIFVFAVLLVSVYAAPKKDLSKGDAWRAPEAPKTSYTDVDMRKAHGQGHDVYAAQGGQIFKHGNNEVHGEANFGRHYGGPYGNSRPNVGGRINYVRRF